ncbi:MAG: HAD family hydrolase [Clostridiales bacterium]
MSAIIFDLDGTLADTVPVILETSRLVCQELHIPWDKAYITSLIGLPLIQTGEKVLGEGFGQLYYDTYQKYFFGSCYKMMKLFPGVKNLLQKLHKQGYQLAIVTSKTIKGANSTIDLLEIKDFFSVVVTATDNCGHKPAPGPAFFALNRLKTDKNDAIFVGDSAFDINCAKEAGIKSCGVTWGAYSSSSLLAAGADYLAHDINQLEVILTESIR